MHPKVFVFLLSKGNNLIGSVRLLECIFFAASMGDQQENFPPFVRSPQKSDTHIHAYTQMIATLAKVLVCRPNDEGSLLWASEDETKADQIRRKQLGFGSFVGKPTQMIWTVSLGLFGGHHPCGIMPLQCRRRPRKFIRPGTSRN